MKVYFLIDGFNLFHSLRVAGKHFRKEGSPTQTKWLNLHSMLSSYVPWFGKDVELGGIVYFSALATHRDHGENIVTDRHKTYIKCLKNTGVDVVLGRFKPRTFYCKDCDEQKGGYEEKETDVAIAVRLMEIFAADPDAGVVLVTGDTDLAPAVRAARRVYNDPWIKFAFPYCRLNRELKRLVPGSFKIKKPMYEKHQFPDVVRISDTESLTKPEHWNAPPPFTSKS